MMLGNLTISQIEQRIGINFPDDIREFMNKTHQHSANKIGEGDWHCFDDPFVIVCGDIDTATKIYNSVKDKSSEVKERLEFAITNS